MMLPMTIANSRRLLPGAIVEVRSWAEIAATLDENGMFEGLPFMAEMLAFCGRRFTVSKRVERTCDETSGDMRRIQDTVFLEALRCGGAAHGGCQKACMLFWKEAWLKRVEGHHDVLVELNPPPASEPCYPYASHLADGEYVCQSTELVRATSHLPFWDLRLYFRDLRAKTHSLPKLLRILSYAVYLRLRRYFTGQSHLVLEGRRTTTPKDALDLQPGELVRVKSKEEITKTLDRRGRNRGLAFTVEMIPFCGGTFRVLGPIEKMVHEPSRRLVHLANTVILQNVVCDGCHILRGGCARANYLYWREIWLERVDPQKPGEARTLRSGRAAPPMQLAR